MRYNVLMKMNKVVDPNSVSFVVMDKDENVDIDNFNDLLKANKE